MGKGARFESCSHCKLNTVIVINFYTLAPYTPTNMKLPHIIALFCTIYIGRILIISLHEIGHALMAYLFTKNKITIYLGSYGKTTNNYKFQKGRVCCYIEYNIFRWKGGLCMREGEAMSYYQSIIYTAAGPLLPVFVALLYFIIAQNILSENFYAFAIFFLIFSALSAIYNLIPKKAMINLLSGGRANNDGYTILTIVRNRKFHNQYKLAFDHFNKKNYVESLHHSQILIDQGMDNDEHIYHIALHSNLLLNNFEHAKTLMDVFESKFDLNVTDYVNFGYYYTQTGEHEQALTYYQKSLQKEETWHALNNIGYSLNLLGQYEEAIIYLDKALTRDPTMAFGYINRGFSSIKMGNIERGLADLETSLKLDPCNAYYYKNMGIYHFDKQEYKIALDLFEKALEIDAMTYKIEDHITETKNMLLLSGKSNTV
jgi:tetratricopeptide (TPR) repeat protein